MKIILKNTARDQRKNKYQPNATCNVTALSNGLACLGVIVEPDELYLKANSPSYIAWSKKLGAWVVDFVQRGKLNQVWAVIEKLADEYLGWEGGGVFGENKFSFGDICNAINDGCPVLISGQFTHGGHIVCVVGYYDLGLICDDSWGNWMTGYKSHNGDDCKYPFTKLEKILKGKNGKYRALILRQNNTILS